MSRKMGISSTTKSHKGAAAAARHSTAPRGLANIIGNRSHFSDLSVLLQFMLRTGSPMSKAIIHRVLQKKPVHVEAWDFSVETEANQGAKKWFSSLIKKRSLGKKQWLFAKQNPVFAPTDCCIWLYDTKVTILFYAISTIKLPPSMIISWFSSPATQEHNFSHLSFTTDNFP